MPTKYTIIGKFEIVFLSSAIGHEQTVLVVMLKSFSRMNRYLAINQKGKVQVTKVRHCMQSANSVVSRDLTRSHRKHTG